MTSFPVSTPVPKPRSCYSRNSFSSVPSAADREEPDSIRTRTETWSGHKTESKDCVPSLGGVSDLIATHIPSLSGFALSIKDSAPSAPRAPPPSAHPPSAPPPSALANSIAAGIPSLAAEANTVAHPQTDIFSSFSDVRSLAGLVSNVTNANAPTATPPADKSLPSADKPLPSVGPFTPGLTDVNALSNLVKTVLQPKVVGVPEVSGLDDSSQAKVEYLTMLSHWTSHEEGESESSNEDEEPAAAAPPPGRLTPSRPAPPPPIPPSQSKKPKARIPRTATLRVSRKKGSGGPPAQSPSVARSSWLDVWKGIRHNVVWATFDGQVMALWKKRTDRFSEVMFHVSNITNIKRQDKGRFSVYLGKKHYDFMAHNDDVQEGWVSSLQLARGCPSPAPPTHHGQITLKEPRSRAYAAVQGSELWVFPNKDSFAVGVASFAVPLNVASVKKSGKHSLSLITPFKTFSVSIDSSKELTVWMDALSSTISSSMGSSQVALRLWDQNPSTKLCADCGAPNPEWASANLLLVLCHTCAGVHRSLGQISKIKSLTMDNKVWTEALIQLFVSLGNRAANQIWAPVVPATEQLSPHSSDEERSKFIHDKYAKGRYRRLHALSSSQDLMDQRLREVVCGDDVDETLSLICSGAKVTQTDLLSPSPIHLAQRAGQALQVELLRLNEFTDVPPPHPLKANDSTVSATSGEEEEELHAKVEDDRFLFSMENDSAACDVLDLREVHSMFFQSGDRPQFHIHTLNGPLVCGSDSLQDLLTHYYQILKVILPSGVSDAEVGGALAVSKVCVVEMGVHSSQSDAWILLWVGGVSLYQKQSCLQLHPITRHEMDPSENTVTLDTRDRSMSFRFEDSLSCSSWFSHLCSALNVQQANQSPALKPGTNPSSAPYPATNKNAGTYPQANQRGGLYPVKSVKGRVPASIERCISHVTSHGLKVEGVYRRCGLTNKVNRLVEALMRSPDSAPLESDEQGVLDAAATLKRLVRQMNGLIPEHNMPQWIKAAVISDERSRFAAYKGLLRDLPDDSRATLNALFAHFYMIQVFSQVNLMSAHNLALVLIPTLFQSLNQDLVRLLREFIIHHTLLFLSGEDSEEVITFF
ncbi:arf-GAP with Rho-GAP domain, ANK repeat and PH domain-containing protein 1-like [Periophthalmus magnuspinnatus]|uniref:arf-GAP with Rho-GAP domain, ANK repeat and PH domain-containing protein 1-like n=1 Tax=Periophthalmus magnuspinnatus TaxID=409849 RepID=UPI0024363C34|nr:arf-GAP with Rho-GAP domain, ANK repeat and PH domain-containing protein 1-like [Periophthalmus magnuspinnatus]